MTKRRALATGAVLDPASNGAPILFELPLDHDEPDELADALVQALPLPPEPEAFAPGVAPDAAARPAPPQRQRRISIEVVKAETRLIQIEQRRDESLRRYALSWDQKRSAFIAGLPEDVRAALVAMRVLEPADAGED